MRAGGLALDEHDHRMRAALVGTSRDGIRFNPTAPETTAELYALILDLSTDAEVSTDFDIDIEEEEPVLEQVRQNARMLEEVLLS
jgi:hypothetical protein